MINNFKFLFFASILLINNFVVFSQQIIYPNSYFISESKYKFQTDEALYPKISFESDNEEIEAKNKKCKTWLCRKLFNENLLDVDSLRYSLKIDPIVHFYLGKESNYKPFLYENTRGIRATALINNKFFVSSELHESQSIFSTYNDAFTENFGVAPGMMRAKRFKENGRDYASAYGIIAYKPNKYLQFDFGRDKLQYGYGYRSLLLSQNAPASTFLKFSFNKNKWNYNYILSSLQNVPFGNIIDVPMSSVGAFQNKYASFSFLSFCPFDFITLSFFEAIIWNPDDYVNNKLQYKHFNPFIFSKTAYYGFNNKNNVLAGVQLKIDFYEDMFFYSQYLIDDISTNSKSNKTALQFGISAFEPFNFNKLQVKTECNIVGAYTYSYVDNPQNSFSHYNHSMAHPFGANFIETLVLSSYKKNRFIAFALFSYSKIGLDSEGKTYGQNIFSNSFDTEMNNSIIPKLNNLNSSLLFVDFRFHYILNNKSNLNVFANCIYRKYSKQINPYSGVVFQVGVSTNFRYNSNNQSIF